MTDFETVETWKDRLDLTDEDILTQEHLNRVATQHPGENEIVYCACGCGEFWLRPIDHESRKQRYVRGHSPRGRASRDLKKKANQLEDIREHARLYSWITFDEIEKILEAS